MLEHGFRYKACVKALAEEGLHVSKAQVTAWGRAARQAQQLGGHGDATGAPLTPARGAERRTDPCPVPAGDMDVGLRELIRESLLLLARVAAGRDRDGQRTQRVVVSDIKDATISLRNLSQTYPDLLRADDQLDNTSRGGASRTGEDVDAVLEALGLDPPPAASG